MYQAIHFCGSDTHWHQSWWLVHGKRKNNKMFFILKGEFYGIKTHTEPPFVAQPFTVPEQSGFMLSLGLSEFTLNSASYGYYSDGGFQLLINNSMVSIWMHSVKVQTKGKKTAGFKCLKHVVSIPQLPPGSPIHLNTSLMGPFVPQVSSFKLVHIHGCNLNEWILSYFISASLVGQHINAFF